MHWPIESFLNASPIGFHAIVSKMVSSHVALRPVASCDHRIRYSFIAGACLAVRMYVGMVFVTCRCSWNRAALVPLIQVGNSPVRCGGMWYIDSAW